MKLLPYKELIAMSKEAVDKALAPSRAKAQKKRAELEVAKLEEAIVKLEQEVNELCSRQDLDYNKILDKMDELELTKRRCGQFSEVISQLFPE